MNCLHLLKHWDHGFESHSRHVCLCACILFVLSCVGSGLATGCRKTGVLPTVLGLRNWSETKCFQEALCSKVGVTGKERESEGGWQLPHFTCQQCGLLLLPFLHSLPPSTFRTLTVPFYGLNHGIPILDLDCLYKDCWTSFSRNSCMKMS
jgi:hypothetical protein